MANVRDTRGCGGRTSSQNPVVEEFVPSSRWREDPRTHSLVVDLPGFKKDELKLQVTGSGDLMISGERKEHEEKIVYFKQTFEVPKNTEMDKTTGKFIGEILYVTVPKKVVEEKRTDEIVEGNASGSQREDGKKSKGNANHLPQGKTGFKNDEVQFQITGSGNLMINGERKVHEDKIVYFEQTFTVPKNMDMDKTTGKFSGEILFVTVPKQVVEEKRNVGFSEEIREYLKNTNSENVVEMLKRNKGIFMTAILAFSLGVLVTRKSESTGN
ncbi:hypothetical protein F2P56_003638 [Juglans regia]|uniref:Uncharacterized protein LOC108999091 n=2 Tax=Juglans regia TaxID=51240 RepID=A0A2I4FIG5_JUGRE|nr:uncharacterized protein LOC108999091 [Juglans regia]KAF5476951.1 hypothetical protein F2P56_003638 [Juglans regia]